MQVSTFLFGEGFAITGGDQWRVRRKAVNPALHKGYLNTMVDRVFAPSALHLADKLQVTVAICTNTVRPACELSSTDRFQRLSECPLVRLVGQKFNTVVTLTRCTGNNGETHW